ncbi:MAG: tRNA pseudouridine(38-40) synthase TruA [Anaerolineales bacterium]|nr:tRNA pseudouridine(38-40) synthase TruA [Anaerolineales bacterium]
MARYKLTLAYDGSNFAGSQKQANARTVQGELENALQQIGWTGKSILMAGRTDTGVHASGQVATFDFSEWNQNSEKLLNAINAKLPSDIAIKKLQIAKAEFHPRFDAVSRTYQYRLFYNPIRDPLREKFAWRVRAKFDEESLKECASLFLGKHDFSAFGSKTSPDGTTIRTITKCQWKKKPQGEWQFEVSADAFLYRMVRRMVFIQISFAQGKCSLKDVRDAVSNKKVNLPSGLAPAHGLALVEVEY